MNIEGDASDAILEVDGSTYENLGVNQQVDIKIPHKSFVNSLDGRAFNQDDDEIDINKSMSSLNLPQTKNEYQEYRKMARHDLNIRQSKQSDPNHQSS